MPGHVELTLDPEHAERFYAENPGAAEDAARERQRLNAEASGDTRQPDPLADLERQAGRPATRPERKRLTKPIPMNEKTVEALNWAARRHGDDGPRKLIGGELDDREMIGAPRPARKLYDDGRRLGRMVARIVLRPVAALAPRRTNGASGRPRATASSTSSSRGGDSGDSSDEPPPPGDGARRLLRSLARAGLNPEALERAAALILVLDGDAAADREAAA
jgi:hypothetical protein